jgi:hypothetical protein
MEQILLWQLCVLILEVLTLPKAWPVTEKYIWHKKLLEEFATPASNASF